MPRNRGRLVEVQLEQFGGECTVEFTQVSCGFEGTQVALDCRQVAASNRASEGLVQRESGYVSGCSEEERGERFTRGRLRQTGEFPEAGGGGRQCDDVIAHEDSGSMVEAAVYTFEAEG